MEDADSPFRKKSTSKEAFSFRKESVQYTSSLASPRVIKTHLPLEFLPPKLLDTCKVIFVSRNPKDACVSFYHHHTLLPDYHFKGDFSDFANLYLKGAVEYGDYWTMLKVKIQCRLLSVMQLHLQVHNKLDFFTKINMFEGNLCMYFVS